MAFAELGRIALETTDIDAMAADLRKLFGMEIEVHSRAEEAFGLKAGVGHDGIELVQRTKPDIPAAKYWKGPLAAVILAVDDLEEAHRRMAAKGVDLVSTTVTDTGFRELFYGDHFHDIPLVLYQKDEVALLDAPASGEFEIDENPSGVPPARPRPA
jgi:hypothetical protein